LVLAAIPFKFSPLFPIIRPTNLSGTLTLSGFPKKGFESPTWIRGSTALLCSLMISSISSFAFWYFSGVPSTKTFLRLVFGISFLAT